MTEQQAHTNAIRLATYMLHAIIARREPRIHAGYMQGPDADRATQ